VKSIKLEENLPQIPRRFGLTILDLARKNEKIVGLHRHALRKFLKIHDGCFKRAFDVGIAEQHAYAVSWNGDKVWLFFATSTPLFLGV
jgi:1-deoxy-D-xylulose-5-phosphate synthase